MTSPAAIALLVRRSLRQHALSSAVTVFATALASGLVMAVFAIDAQARQAFIGAPVGFDAVLGARGSQLQLVLNTVFHLETSPGNIPWSLYQALRDDPRVQLALPYAVGDNFRGFRIVGTTEELFTRFEPTPGTRLEIEPGGDRFDPTRREAVVGGFAAAQTGLRVGSRLHPSHGLSPAEHEEHDEEYVVVGVLRPTGGPIDRVIWIPIEGVFRMGGHELRGGGETYVPQPGVEIPDERKQVSAVMLSLRGPTAGLALFEEFNRRRNDATLAWPISTVIGDLFNKIGWVNRVLTLVAYLTVVVSAGAILAAIYNTINERRREFAILRALGARRGTLWTAIVLESAAIAALGAICGLLIYAAIMMVAAEVIRAQTGVMIEIWKSGWVLLIVPIGMTAVGALAGLLPAWKAYATDVSTNLSPTT
ncbi:MAG: ABC transporter permease [Phycisphaerae bacterium]